MVVSGSRDPRADHVRPIVKQRLVVGHHPTAITGTRLCLCSTAFMHELEHNLGLTHGGIIGSVPSDENYKLAFQCSTDFPDPALGPASGSAAPPASTLAVPIVEPELTFEQASKRHLIYPQRRVNVSIRPGCSEASKPIAPGQAGSITVALFGESDLDVSGSTHRACGSAEPHLSRRSSRMQTAMAIPILP